MRSSPGEEQSMGLGEGGWNDGEEEEAEEDEEDADANATAPAFVEQESTAFTRGWERLRHTGCGSVEGHNKLRCGVDVFLGRRQHCNPSHGWTMSVAGCKKLCNQVGDQCGGFVYMRWGAHAYGSGACYLRRQPLKGVRHQEDRDCYVRPRVMGYHTYALLELGALAARPELAEADGEAKEVEADEAQEGGADAWEDDEDEEDEEDEEWDSEETVQDGNGTSFLATQQQEWIRMRRKDCGWSQNDPGNKIVCGVDAYRGRRYDCNPSGGWSMGRRGCKRLCEDLGPQCGGFSFVKHGPRAYGGGACYLRRDPQRFMHADSMRECFVKKHLFYRYDRHWSLVEQQVVEQVPKYRRTPNKGKVSLREAREHSLAPGDLD